MFNEMHVIIFYTHTVRERFVYYIRHCVFNIMKLHLFSWYSLTSAVADK